MTRIRLFVSLTSLLVAIAAAPAAAERTCRSVVRAHPIQTFMIARPADQAPCITVDKRTGSVLIVTVRDIENAAAGEVNVIAAPRAISPYEEEEASLPLPSSAGLARIIPIIDDVDTVTISIEPRHARGYKLQVMVHDIDVATFVKKAAADAAVSFLARELLGAIAGDAVGDNPIIPFMVKAAKLYAKSETEAQFVDQLAAAFALDAALGQTDMPRGLRTIVSVFVGHALKEVGTAAATAPAWSLPSHVVDTSAPR